MIKILFVCHGNTAESRELAVFVVQNEANLVSLCQSCHARIHVERGDRWQKK